MSCTKRLSAPNLLQVLHEVRVFAHESRELLLREPDSSGPGISKLTMVARLQVLPARDGVPEAAAPRACARPRTTGGGAADAWRAPAAAPPELAGESRDDSEPAISEIR